MKRQGPQRILYDLAIKNKKIKLIEDTVDEIDDTAPDPVEKPSKTGEKVVKYSKLRFFAESEEQRIRFINQTEQKQIGTTQIRRTNIERNYPCSCGHIPAFGSQKARTLHQRNTNCQKKLYSGKLHKVIPTIPDDIPTAIPDDIPTAIPDDIPRDIPDDIPRDIPADIPDDIPQESKPKSRYQKIQIREDEPEESSVTPMGYVRMYSAKYPWGQFEELDLDEI
jgi:hypothetical protein